MKPEYNVIVIMTDQMRATASHLWGNADCTTPHLEELAERGVLYENAFTPHPLCVPARVSLWTSQYTHTHGSRRNQTYLSAGMEHAFRIWKRNGYKTGLIGKNHCFRDQEDLSCFDVWCEINHKGFIDTFPVRGMPWFRPIEAVKKAHTTRKNMPTINPVFSYAFTDYPLQDYSTGLITGQTVRFIEQYKEEPFVLWVSYPDPHAPYEAPRSYADQFDLDSLELPPINCDDMESAPERNRVLNRIMSVEGISEEELKNFLIAYYAMILAIDDGVKIIIEELKKQELEQKTVVVFCSDHGDFALEHGMTTKGGVFYDSLTHVPLIVSCPDGSKQGYRESSLVSLVDVLPTLFEIQGIPGPSNMQGKPLPVLTDVSPRQYVFSEYGAGGFPFTMAELEKHQPPYGREMLLKSLQWREAEGRRKMVRSQRWKYVHDPTGDKDELYDLRSDPQEFRNCVDDPENTSIVKHMKDKLLDWSIETEGGPSSTPLPNDREYNI